jgi:hypothetical protein
MKRIAIIMGLLSINSISVQARTGDVSYEFETMLQSKTIDMNLRVPNSLEEKEVSSEEIHSADGTEPRPEQSEQ